MVDANEPESSQLAGQKQPKTADASRDFLSHLLQHLATQVRREQLETWFRSLDVMTLNDREISFTVTSQFVRDWLQKYFLKVIQDAVGTISDRLSPSAPRSKKPRVVLRYREEDGFDALQLAGIGGITPPLAQGISQVMGPLNQPRSSDADDRRDQPVVYDSVGSTSGGSPGGGRGVQTGGTHTGKGTSAPRLNPNYTFDKFVVGQCNRLAHASALAIGENPGLSYNPLFVHGNVGLGKTHLLQAICHRVLSRSPDARVLYMSCEDFTNAFIVAIQQHEVEAFRRFHRDADVLVIDDVQFLANKDKTQDEFFHTFNALYDGQRQIVLSSDRPPSEIPTIEERLVSRFKWGLVAEVEAPCVETRKTIVRRKAVGRGAELPEDVVDFLADRVATNIRELEGAVIKVVGIAAITEQPITLALAESCMKGVAPRHGHVSADDVIGLVTAEFSISARELIGKSRTQIVSLPRQIAMFLIREHTENSLEDVGRIFGDRDHTTVLYAVNKVKERLGRDRSFKDLLDGLGGRLLSRPLR
ncbi:MAG: chromosomal replication initiator protein DnaA [Planctomycetota bacterium]